MAGRRRLVAGTALVAALALAPGASGGATVYRWVDEHGRAHFSDRPPPGKGERVDVRPAPPPGGVEGEGAAQGAGGKDRVGRQRRLLRAFEAERREREAARRAAEARRRQRTARCRHARRRLAIYERVNVVYETDAEGRRRALSDAERAARMAALREEIARWCD